MSQPTITAIRPILTAPGGTIRLVVVKVETSEPGLYGVGCATYTQRPTAVATAVTDYLEPLLVGREVHRIEDAWHTMMGNAYWRNGPVVNNAVSGVDQALWDIKGKLAGLPVYELLGGRCRDTAAVYRHATGREPSEVADRAEEYMAEGVRYVRCQLGGYGSGGRVVEQASAAQPGAYFDPAGYARSVPKMFGYLRERLGEEVELLHDVHERLVPIDAIRLAKQLEEFNLYFLEDVLPPERTEWLQQLRAQCATPIALGELFNHPQEWMPLITGRLIDLIRCHVSQIGGLTPARKLAELAEPFGVRTAWHGPGDTSPIGHIAQLHLEVVSPNFGVHEFSGFGEQVHEVFPGCPTAVDGALRPSDAPGLGIDIDEAAAAKYPIHDEVVAWTQTRLFDGTPVWA